MKESKDARKTLKEYPVVGHFHFYEAIEVAVQQATVAADVRLSKALMVH